MLPLALLPLLLASSQATKAIWSYSCYDLVAGVSFINDVDEITDLQAFRTGDVIDEYSDNVRIGNYSLSDLLRYERDNDHPSLDWAQIVTINTNAEQDCALDFVVLFNSGHPNHTIITRLAGYDVDDLISTPMPVTVLAQDMCTVLVPNSLKPDFDVLSGFIGASTTMFSTSSPSVKSLNVTRLFIYGPVFTVLPHPNLDFGLFKCDPAQFPAVFTLNGGEDYLVLSSTDAFPDALALSPKKLSFSGTKAAALTMNIRDFSLIGRVTVACDDSGLSKTFQGAGQFDTFKVRGLNFTVDYATILTQQQLLSGNQGTKEHFTLHIQPSRK